MMKPINKVLDVYDAAGQLAFYAVVGTALGIGTCWAITKVVTGKVTDQFRSKKRSRF